MEAGSELLGAELITNGSCTGDMLTGVEVQFAIICWLFAKSRKIDAIVLLFLLVLALVLVDSTSSPILGFEAWSFIQVELPGNIW